MRKSTEIEIGAQFGFWTVIQKVKHPEKRGMAYECECRCGQRRLIQGWFLVNNSTGSCRNCRSQNRFPYAEYLRLRWSWRDMIRRCEDKTGVHFYRYGGRGISVVTEWKDFNCFAEWALKSGYGEGLSLDRIDNDGGYCPSNCRFVTHKENCNNRSSNVLISAFGETKTVAEWATDARCVVSEGTLRQRAKRNKWSGEVMLTSKSLKRGGVTCV